MAFTDAPDIFFSQLALPAAAALNSTGVKLRIPLLDNINVMEFGVRMVANIIPSGACIIKIQGELADPTTPVDLTSAASGTTINASLTVPAGATRGFLVKKFTDVEVLKSVYSNLVLNVTTADGNATTGIVYIKCRVGGSTAAAELSEIIVTT